MYQYYFEKLTTWQDAKALVMDIYKLTKTFPTGERFGLVSQLQRAAISVTANIAEGSSRQTPKDQANFSTMAYASLMEVLNLLIIAHELEYINRENYQITRLQVDKVANKINALRKKQTNN